MKRKGNSVKKQKAIKITPVRPIKGKETKMESIASIAGLLAVGLFIVTLNVQAFEIPSSSMENTLLIGDHLFVDRVTLAPKTKWMPLIPYRSIHRGDIVVFLSPAEPGLFLVKRIIGLPGDKIHLENGVVYRNGEKLNEPYAIHSVGNFDPFRDNFPRVAPPEGNDIWVDWQLTMSEHVQEGNIVVPPDTFFAMGDNRDVSRDSRYWGFVPAQNVIGRPMFIYWSFETSAGQYLKTDTGDRLKFVGKVVIHFFDETRWNRMFRVVR